MKVSFCFGFLCILTLAAVVSGLESTIPEIVHENQHQSHIPTAYAQSDATESVQYPSPLQQYTDGIPLHEIQCNTPRELYVTGSQMPICLYPDTYQMLLDRGVSLSMPPTQESVIRAVTEDTIAMYDSDPDGAFATINAMMSTDPSYPFIVDSDGVVVAHGSNPDHVGVDSRAISATNKPVEVIIAELQKGNVWVEYAFHNPATEAEQYKRSLIVLHDGYVFGSGYYVTPESIVRGVVEDTIAMYGSDPDGAFATITAMMANYPSYPFVIDSNGIVVAHGSNPDHVGVDSRAISATNKPADVVISELEEGEMWVEYTFTNPATGAEQHKRSLIVLHDGYIFGSGYYPILDKMTGGAMTLLELTAEETAWLEENDSIRISYDPGWFPIEYADESGNLAGTTLRYAAEFSKLTGASFVGIPAPSSWNDALEMMRSDNADVMFMIVSTPERLDYMSFTSSHYIIEVGIITPDDRQATLADEDLRLLTISGYATEGWLDENHPDVEYISVGSFEEGFELMRTGEANAFAAVWPVIAQHAESAGIDLYNAGSTGYQYDLLIAYDSDKPLLGSILQKTLDQIPASQIEQWWNDALPAQ